jgi:hypothetical protein
MTARYDALLCALYDPAAPPPVPADRVARFEIERTRRILDIARLISTQWPRTSALARAWSGDDAVHATAREIPGLRATAQSFADAVDTAFATWVVASDAAVLRWVHRFEQAKRGKSDATRPPTADELRRLTSGSDPARVLDVPSDLMQTVRTVDFLTARGATAEMLRQIALCGPATSIAFFSRGGQVYAVPVG